MNEMMHEANMETKTSEAIRNIRTAMLLFLIDVNILGFDILPDFFGWMCLIGAVDILTGKAEGIERIRTFGKVMLWYELLLVVLNYVGHLVPFVNDILSYMGIFLLSIRIYFMYIILTAAAGVGAKEGGEADTLKGIRHSRSRVLLAEVALYLAAAIQGTEQIGGWVYVPTVLYFLFYMGCILHLIALREEVEIWEKAQTETEGEREAVME